MLVGVLTETKVSSGKKEVVKTGFKNLTEFNEWVDGKSVKNQSVVLINGDIDVDVTALSYGAKIAVKGTLIQIDTPLEARIKEYRNRGDIASIYNDVKRLYNFN